MTSDNPSSRPEPTREGAASGIGIAGSVTGRRPQRYRQLDEGQIIETLQRLHDRIAERFPDAGLVAVSEELLALAHEANACVDYLRRPHWPTRIGVGLSIVAMTALLVALGATFRPSTQVAGLAELVQMIESGINDVIFLAIAVFFLLTLESRIKRRKALSALHELRSLVHIVDMHQLTKDPELLHRGVEATPPVARVMTPEELGRYLDYCSEMLSLSSKVAALFVQHFNDPVVLGAVNEIESLATGFSGKIWQKITLLERSGGVGNPP